MSIFLFLFLSPHASEATYELEAWRLHAHWGGFFSSSMGSKIQLAHLFELGQSCFAANIDCRHLSLLFCIVRYGLSYISFNYYSRWAIFSYRLAFISAAATYGIVVYKAFRARARAGRAQGGLISLVADENVQYLGMYIHGKTGKQSANTNYRNGTCLAILQAIPSRHASIWCLLYLPRRNLHPHKPYPHYSTPTAGSFRTRCFPYLQDRPEAQRIGRHYW
jgi:hypothetical protein